MKKHIYFWAFAILVVVLFKSMLLNKFPIDNEATRNFVNNPEVSSDEMHKFLQVWPKYINNDVSKLAVFQVSFKDDLPSKSLNKKVINWLDSKDWNTDRFFYVEQRLRAIVQTIENKKHVADMQKILQTQLATEKNPSVIESIQQNLASQVQGFNVERISPEEQDMVEQNLDVIKGILDGSKRYSEFKSQP